MINWWRWRELNSRPKKRFSKYFYDHILILPLWSGNLKSDKMNPDRIRFIFGNIPEKMPPISNK